MRVLLVLLLVGIVSHSEGRSYEDGDHLSAEWHHRQSHEYSGGFKGSQVALADGDVNLANSGESDEEPKIITNWGSIKAEPTTEEPKLTFGRIDARTTEEPKSNLTFGRIDTRT